jgi:hypothetical protein
VDPVADPVLLRKSGSARNRTRISGSVARNSDHYITEAVGFNASFAKVLDNYVHLTVPPFIKFHSLFLVESNTSYFESSLPYPFSVYAVALCLQGPL